MAKTKKYGAANFSAKVFVRGNFTQTILRFKIGVKNVDF